MFESNADFELDEIFDVPFEINGTSAPVKRTNDFKNNPNESTISNKKLRPDTRISTPALMQTTSFLSVDNSKRSSSLPTTSITSFESPRQRVVLRKFPGPAGLLPERIHLNIDVKMLEDTHKEKSSKHNYNNHTDIEGFCSQMSIQAFQEGPWLQMSKDFQPDSANESLLPDKYNIAWIKSRAEANKLINQKAPFLVAIIQNIECLNLKTAIVTVLLKDSTGEIQGTIVHDLFEEHVKLLIVGSVIVLKQVGVLTTDHGANHYLTITANNLIRIYSRENDVMNVKTTIIQRFTVKDFYRNINEVKSRHRTALFERKSDTEIDFEEVLLKLRSTSGNNKRGSQKTVNNNKEMMETNKIVLPRCRSANYNCEQSAVLPLKVNTRLNNENLIKEPNKAKFNFKSTNKKQCAVESSFLSVIKTNNEETVQKNTFEIINDVKCNSISMASCNSENGSIMENIFEGVDTDSLFEDF